MDISNILTFYFLLFFLLFSHSLCLTLLSFFDLRDHGLHHLSDISRHVAHVVTDSIRSLPNSTLPKLIGIWKLQDHRLVLPLPESQDLRLFFQLVDRFLARPQYSASITIEATIVRRTEDCYALWLIQFIEHVLLEAILLHFVSSDK